MSGHDVIGVIVGPSLALAQLSAHHCALPILPGWISVSVFLANSVIFHPGMFTKLIATKWPNLHLLPQTPCPGPHHPWKSEDLGTETCSELHNACKASRQITCSFNASHRQPHFQMPQKCPLFQRLLTKKDALAITANTVRVSWLLLPLICLGTWAGGPPAGTLLASWSLGGRSLVIQLLTLTRKL